MGLSFYYSGKFNKNANLSDLITEVKEIAKTFKWKFQIYEESFPDNIQDDIQFYNDKIYGISITPPHCETISICFLSNYKMSSIVHLKFYGNSAKESENDFLYMLSTKTQFAGVFVHKTVIQLFRYLNQRKYFEEFELIDDGQYWETGDEKLLEKKFKENGDLIDNFSIAVETIPAKQNESFEKYFERIIKTIDDRNKKLNNLNT